MHIVRCAVPTQWEQKQVDVFLDLACEDSAFAWTTIKQMVREYESRTKFVFHVLPMPHNQMALDTAKVCEEGDTT